MDQRSQVLLLLAFIKFFVVAAQTDPNDGMFFGLSSYFGAIISCREQKLLESFLGSLNIIDFW
jgi:hypothetical protein